MMAMSAFSKTMVPAKLAYTKKNTSLKLHVQRSVGQVRPPRPSPPPTPSPRRPFPRGLPWELNLSSKGLPRNTLSVLDPRAGGRRETRRETKPERSIETVDETTDVNQKGRYCPYRLHTFESESRPSR